MSTQWQVNLGLDLGITGGPNDSVSAALSLGASWSSTRTEGTSKGESHTPPADAACGYWAYIPVNVGYVTHEYMYHAYMRTNHKILNRSCGTLSVYNTEETRTSGGWTGTWSSTYHCSKEGTTTQHVCTNRALIDDNGVAAGATVFVKQDCSSGRTLCKKHQPREFQQQTNPDTKWSMEYSGDVENCLDDANAWIIGAQKLPLQTTANLTVAPTVTSAPNPGVIVSSLVGVVGTPTQGANSPTSAPVDGGDCAWKGHCSG